VLEEELAPRPEGSEHGSQEVEVLPHQIEERLDPKRANLYSLILVE
jgi:hypothetical protein